MSAIAPYLETELPACSIIIDRHTHKNAGSSMRKIYRFNDLFHDWLSYYYNPVRINSLSTKLAAVMMDARHAARRASWGDSSSRLRSSGRVGPAGQPSNISSGRCLFRAPLRFSIEHHYTRVLTDTLVENFGALAPLQQIAGMCSCRIVLFTRLREPVQFYISFYRWTVMWRQKSNSTLHGRDIFEWAPPNLHSSIFLDPVQAAAVRVPEARGGAHPARAAASSVHVAGSRAPSRSCPHTTPALTATTSSLSFPPVAD